MEKECGLAKPKSPNKAAQKMSDKRKAEQEMLGNLDDNQLLDLYVAYKAQDNLDKAKVVKREMDSRNSAETEKVNSARKALREKIIKQVKQTMDLVLLEEVSAMLPKLVEKSE